MSQTMTLAIPRALVAQFSFDGEPVSKSRARFTNRGSKTRAYTPERTRQAESTVAWHFRQAVAAHNVDGDHTFGISAVFYQKSRQRRDVDNMLKLVSDALTGVVWVDDSQVDEVSGRRAWDDERPHTDVMVYRIGDVWKPTRACVGCGTEFTTYKSQSDRKYCTRTCRVANSERPRDRICEHCGKTYTAHSILGAQRFCSKGCAYVSKNATLQCRQCGAEYRRAQSVVKGPSFCSHDCRQAYWSTNRVSETKGNCADCGAPKSKRSYTHCAACALLHRKKRSAV